MMKAKPYVVISMKSGDALLFFGVELHAKQFLESTTSYKRFRPSFIIYDDTLYTHPRVRFSPGDAGNNYFKKTNPLSLDEYDSLHGMIMEEYISQHRMKPNMALNTGGSTAYFFFKSHEEMELFNHIGIHPPGGVIPRFIIHQETLFCRPGFYFVAGDAGSHYFSSTDVLSEKEYKLLTEMIINSHKTFENAKEAVKDLRKSDHHVDALAYNVHLMGYKFPQDPLEKKLIDQLNIPGLESALREALKRENYEAAAYIRDKVKEKGHMIFEDKDRLIVRRPALKNTNQNK